eukprot:scaffold4725_cov367-Prasinococcus_capsulatus_cf.AAC.4
MQSFGEALLFRKGRESGCLPLLVHAMPVGTEVLSMLFGSGEHGAAPVARQLADLPAWARQGLASLDPNTHATAAHPAMTVAA